MKRYSSEPRIDHLVRTLVRAGWDYRRGGKHGVLRPPGPGRVVVPGTPGDARAFANFRAEVRRTARGAAAAAPADASGVPAAPGSE